ncbi:hypothetical protein J31TS6_44040 [Brevibacillus reuszeri]|nr:hypothetical protein J31TS6_44040 [Brevibacillus reuszeri]
MGHRFANEKCDLDGCRRAVKEKTEHVIGTELHVCGMIYGTSDEVPFFVFFVLVSDVCVLASG